MTGSFVLLLLGLCSIVGLAVFIERMVVLRRSAIDSDQLLLQLRSSLQEGDIVDSIRCCEEAGGSIAHIIKAGLTRHSRGIDNVEAAMEAAGRLEIASLEKNARALAIISHLAPLLGLLGTVLGFIQAFGEMRTSGLVDITASHIGSALEYALITTAAGLVVAIPTLVGYNYILSRVETIVLEMQTIASEVVEILLSEKSDRFY